MYKDCPRTIRTRGRRRTCTCAQCYYSAPYTFARMASKIVWTEQGLFRARLNGWHVMRCSQRRLLPWLMTNAERNHSYPVVNTFPKTTQREKTVWFDSYPSLFYTVYHMVATHKTFQHIKHCHLHVLHIWYIIMRWPYNWC